MSSYAARLAGKLRTRAGFWDYSDVATPSEVLELRAAADELDRLTAINAELVKALRGLLYESRGLGQTSRRMAAYEAIAKARTDD